MRLAVKAPLANARTNTRTRRLFATTGSIRVARLPGPFAARLTLDLASGCLQETLLLQVAGEYRATSVVSISYCPFLPKFGCRSVQIRYMSLR